MEIIDAFIASHTEVVYYIMGIITAALIWLSIPAKKPKSHGILHVIHYPNGFKELYVQLNDDIEKFENDPKVCFDVKIDNRG